MDYISFDEESAQAIKDGKKSVTRRPLKNGVGRYYVGQTCWAKTPSCPTKETSPFKISIRINWIQRLHGITPRDVELEGIDVVSYLPMIPPMSIDIGEIVDKIAKDLFQKRWDGIYGDTPYCWNNNPPVQALFFEVIN